MKASRPTLIGLLMRVVGSPTLTFYFVYVSATLLTVKGGQSEVRRFCINLHKMFNYW